MISLINKKAKISKNQLLNLMFSGKYIKLIYVYLIIFLCLSFDRNYFEISFN